MRHFSALEAFQYFIAARSDQKSYTYGFKIVYYKALQVFIFISHRFYNKEMSTEY